MNLWENTVASSQASFDCTTAEHIREVRILRPATAWTAENFAREQVRSLVRQVFFNSMHKDAKARIRQVVFSAPEAETDVRSLCRRTGEILALENVGSVAVMGSYPRICQRSNPNLDGAAEAKSGRAMTPLRRIASRIQENLWLVPNSEPDSVPVTAKLHSDLFDLRREFDYSILEAPPFGQSQEVSTMAQLADGVVLVLSARHTRRAAAVSLKRSLEMVQARILGTVLIDRTFPIPEKIYRRL
jgi:hypothetical protein